MAEGPQPLLGRLGPGRLARITLLEQLLEARRALGARFLGQSLRAQDRNDHAVQHRQPIDQVLPVGDDAELEKGGLLDDRLGSLDIRDPRQLDDDAIHTHALNGGLRNAELVDPVANDLARPVGGIGARIAAHRALRVRDLEDQVSPAPQVETQLQGPTFFSADPGPDQGPGADEANRADQNQPTTNS